MAELHLWLQRQGCPHSLMCTKALQQLETAELDPLWDFLRSRMPALADLNLLAAQCAAPAPHPAHKRLLANCDKGNRKLQSASAELMEAQVCGCAKHQAASGLQRASALALSVPACFTTLDCSPSGQPDPTLKACLPLTSQPLLRPSLR